MEDEFTITGNKSLFGVFDGHGGSLVSRHIKSTFATYFERAVPPHSYNTPNLVVEEALRASAQQIDFEVCRNKRLDSQGSTLCAVHINENKTPKRQTPHEPTAADLAALFKPSTRPIQDENYSITSINIGDSRAVLSRGGKAIDLTRDHKPDLPDETKRIEALGGRVVWVGDRTKTGEPILNRGVYRVNGNLALSRAIGDKYLRPYVTAEPEINTLVGRTDDEFIICATDGLWDVFSSQDAVDFVHVILGLAKDEDMKQQEEALKQLSEHDRASFGQLGTIAGSMGLKLKCLDDDESVYKSTRTNMSRYLVTEALRAGTYDNVTVVVMWLRRIDTASLVDTVASPTLEA